MLKHIRLCLLSIGVCSSVAWSNETCTRLLQMPPVERTLQPQYMVEIDSAGHITKAAEALPQFKTGHHLFLITSDGEILTSPQYDPDAFLKTGKGLVTHKSLLKMYEEENLESVAQKIVGAGEFQIAFDVVARISNKAGNFQTDPERLYASVDYLQHRGLPSVLKDNILPVDINKKEDYGHTPFDRNVHEFRLQYMAEVMASPNGPRLLELYERFYGLIRRTFGPLSGIDAIKVMSRARRAGQRLSNFDVGAETFPAPLASAFTVDGIHFGILALMSRSVLAAPNTFEADLGRSATDQIYNILHGLPSPVDDDLRLDWKRLAKDFVDLSAGDTGSPTDPNSAK